jgi:O-acetyl-ADP-ribose deacetylase (regulator of RNase III)
MEQRERREFLIKALLAEYPRYASMAVPQQEEAQRRLLRSLMNQRMPRPVNDEVLRVQDAYLQQDAKERGITQIDDLTPIEPNLYVWKGDITLLAADGIVNAANSQMLGCFVPCHGCIDNAIHTHAGIQLRLECADLMQRQGHEEETGLAKITKAYNLPSKFVLHTVGPVVQGRLNKEHCRLLQSCYLSCLTLAAEKGIKSLAFCCISTGVFGFPKREAAQIAVQTVKAYQEKTGSAMKIIFNVFAEEDYEIYRELLQ